MNKWWIWVAAGAVVGLVAFIWIQSKKKPGGDTDQLAAARQARLDKLALQKAEAETPTNGTNTETTQPD